MTWPPDALATDHVDDTEMIFAATDNEQSDAINALVAHVVALEAALASLQASATVPGAASSAYTPTLSATVANPTLGTGGVAAGRFLQLGKLVFVEFDIKFGTSGNAAGNGIYRVSLPVPGRTIFPLIGSQPLPSYGFAVNLAVTAYPIGIEQDTTATVLMRRSSNGVAITNAAPVTWGASDEFTGGFIYEAA